MNGWGGSERASGKGGGGRKWWCGDTPSKERRVGWLDSECGHCVEIRLMGSEMLVWARADGCEG